MSAFSSVSSNLGKGQQYFERLEALLKDCDVTEMPFRYRRVSRSWIATRIGCKPATLTSNIRLKKTLAKWENSLPAKDKDTLVPESEGGFDDTNVIRLPLAELDDIILPVQATIKGGVFRVPVLFDGVRVDEWVSAYLRHLRITNEQKYSSAEETAKKLRLFRRFQRENRVKTEDVGDDFLLAWQNSMRAAGLQLNRRNDCLGCVHNFFKWLEERGFLKYHTQLRGMGDYHNLVDDYVFPISSVEKTYTRKGAIVTVWVSTLHEPGGHDSFGSRNTPTFKQFEKLVLSVEAHPRNATRNRLLMSWAIQTGARISELVQIRAIDIPSGAAIAKLIDQDEEFYNIVVDRKNKGKDALRLPLDLVMETHDYLTADPDREKIVKSKRGSANQEYLFLSEKGGVLTTDSITRICRGFFEVAQIERANIHRLRARFITEIIEQCLDDMESNGQSLDMTSDWGETVLTVAKTRMGHSHIMSLRPYLNDIRIRRIQVTGHINPRSEADQRGQVVNLRTHMLERIKRNADLVEVDRLSEEGASYAAIAKMKQMIQEMEAKLIV